MFLINVPVVLTKNYANDNSSIEDHCHQNNVIDSSSNKQW